MIEPTMLYKWPGSHNIHNDKFDYVIVDISDVNGYINAGWSLTTEGAKNAGVKHDDHASPTRAELEQKATELGIKLHGRMTDKTIEQLIEARLRANETTNN